MIEFKYGVDETPKSKAEHVFLSIQHVFAMFGATILVPILIGIDAGVALFCAGLGTLIYSFVTKQKVPVFIGSSFAYIALLQGLMKTGGQSAVGLAVMGVGVLYIIISIVTTIIGVKWLDYILPPVVMGPLIIVIGLSLAPVAMANSGLSEGAFDYKSVIVAIATLTSALVALELGNGFTKSIPILIGIIVGYVVSLAFGMIDTSVYSDMTLFTMPKFHLSLFASDFKFDSTVLLAILPLAVVTVAEHIGDHSVSSAITGRNFLKDPGLKRTILGDGLATLVAGFIGGPVNTTYAENTGVIILTRVASVKVIQLAALFAMVIAFLNPVVIFIGSIPPAVMGGVSIALFGLIALNGIRIMMDSSIDFNHTRNMIIVAVILVVGLGGGYISFNMLSTKFVFSGMSLAALFGIIVHLILPHRHLSLKPEAENAEDMIHKGE